MDTSLLRQLDVRRRRLHMTKSAVARLAGVSLPTVNRILQGKEQNPGIVNLMAIAATLGVTAQLSETLTIQETKSDHEFRKDRALAKAKRIVRLVQGTMALEAQGVDANTINQMVDQTMCELMAGPANRLWED